MPFIGKDWRSPGHKWIRLEDGWEEIKLLDSSGRIKKQTKDGSQLDSAEENCINQETLIPINYDSVGLANQYNSHPIPIIFKPCLFNGNKRYSSPRGFTSLKEAFRKLDFLDGIDDIKRFNYISKVLSLLIRERLHELSGSAQKCIFALAGRVIERGVAECRNFSLLRTLVRELSKALTIGPPSFGLRVGCESLWNGHARDIQRWKRELEGAIILGDDNVIERMNESEAKDWEKYGIVANKDLTFENIPSTITITKSNLGKPEHGLKPKFRMSERIRRIIGENFNHLAPDDDSHKPSLYGDNKNDKLLDQNCDKMYDLATRNSPPKETTTNTTTTIYDNGGKGAVVIDIANNHKVGSLKRNKPIKLSGNSNKVLKELPKECVFKIVSCLSDHQDLINLSKCCDIELDEKMKRLTKVKNDSINILKIVYNSAIQPAVDNINHDYFNSHPDGSVLAYFSECSQEAYIWKKLCAFHFTEQQITKRIAMTYKDATTASTTSDDKLDKHDDIQVDWQMMYFKLKRYYGVKEIYANMLHFCLGCKCIYWKGLGHPCDHDPDETKPHPSIRIYPHEFIEIILY
ncbi:unnamed protein product [Gordionus sp. m RMFG-2023]|uniref:F-box only protein 25-like isoform X2 n=1 Tax=Gordionus sp. m RMFG-2023 TaxID=3053472 RepID=UPI0030DE75C5